MRIIDVFALSGCEYNYGLLELIIIMICMNGSKILNVMDIEFYRRVGR